MHAPSARTFSILRNTHILLTRNYSSLTNKQAIKCLVNLDVQNVQFSFFGSTQRKYSIFKERVKELEADFPSYGQPLESWHYDVQQFGTLKVRSPMSIHVQPLNFQKHPEMNKIYVNILYTGAKSLSLTELANLTKLYIVTVKLDVNSEEIDVTIKHKDGRVDIPAVCHLQIPLKYDLDIACRDEAEATLENLESTNININTRSGNCTSKDIKACDVHIQTVAGDIVSKSLLQGNVHLRCGTTGDIEAGRLQGQNISCQTGSGNICVKSAYAVTSSFKSASGNVRIGSCHGKSNVSIENGNLTVDALDGDMTTNITEGKTSVYVAREGHLNLNSSQGDMEVSVPKSLCASVCLRGSSVDLGDVSVTNSVQEANDDNISLKGDLGPSTSTSGEILVRTDAGTVYMQYQDWFRALKLKQTTT